MNDINLFFNKAEFPLIKKNLKLFCKEILHYKGYSNYLISLIFINEEELKEMKHKFFKQDFYTDVIAFNLNNKSEGITFINPNLLGSTYKSSILFENLITK